MPKLGDALKTANAGLLREIGEVLRDPFFAGFLTRIDGVFESDVVDGRSSFSAKTRQVFAVKSGVDAFLDIARRNFCEATEAAHELIRALRERTGLESPRLDYTANGMFQIKVTRSDFGRYSVNASHIDASLPTLHAIDALGDDATRPIRRDDDDAAGVRNDRVVRCTCDGLDVINRRCVDSADEAMRRSAAAVRANVAAFYSLIQSMPGAVFAAWSCWTAVSRCRGSRNHPGGARLAENQHDGAVFRGRGGGDRQVRWQRILLRTRHLLPLGAGVSIHHGIL